MLPGAQMKSLIIDSVAIIKQKCMENDQRAQNELGITPSEYEGIKAFANACIDHTPRKLLRRFPYGFILVLFVCIVKGDISEYLASQVVLYFEQHS